MTAADNGLPALTKLLLEAGAQVDAADEAGQTALIPAAKKGWLPVATVLLGGGAQPYDQDHTGDSALTHAAKRSNYTMADRLDVKGHGWQANEVPVLPVVRLQPAAHRQNERWWHCSLGTW